MNGLNLIKRAVEEYSYGDGCFSRAVRPEEVKRLVAVAEAVRRLPKEYWTGEMVDAFEALERG